MSDDHTLREKVREAISTGRLPAIREGARGWGGRGCGARCTVCAEVLQPDEVEIELEFTNPDPGTGHGAGHGRGDPAVNGNGHVAGNGNGHSGGGNNGYGAGTDKRYENAHLHLRCLTAWELECSEIKVGPRVTSASGLPTVSEGGTIARRGRRANQSESADSGVSE
jgi:hypothetical protein